jgi:hypothetical protein
MAHDAEFADHGAPIARRRQSRAREQKAVATISRREHGNDHHQVRQVSNILLPTQTKQAEAFYSILPSIPPRPTRLAATLPIVSPCFYQSAAIHPIQALILRHIR